MSTALQLSVQAGQGQREEHLLSSYPLSGGGDGLTSAFDLVPLSSRATVKCGTIYDALKATTVPLRAARVFPKIIYIKRHHAFSPYKNFPLQNQELTFTLLLFICVVTLRMFWHQNVS